MAVARRLFVLLCCEVLIFGIPYMLGKEFFDDYIHIIVVVAAIGLLLAVFMPLRSTQLKRYSLRELRSVFSGKSWDMTGKNTSECFDLLDAIKQSAIDGRIKILGRLDQYGDASLGLTKNEPLVPISTEHFQDGFDFDIQSFLQHEDNFNIGTARNIRLDNESLTRGAYRDIFVEVDNLGHWADEIAHFKGRRDKANESI